VAASAVTTLASSDAMTRRPPPLRPLSTIWQAPSMWRYGDLPGGVDKARPRGPSEPRGRACAAEDCGTLSERHATTGTPTGIVGGDRRWPVRRFL
jgi:hypothetical protein